MASNNQLVRLPASITRLRALDRLDVRNNPLEELPEDIGSMAGLTHLDPRATRIAQVPDSLVGLPRAEKPRTPPRWAGILREHGCRVLL